MAEDDSIIQTHNTLAFQLDRFFLGAFLGYEKLHSETTDTSTGAMIKFGTSGYIEIQAGAFQRKIKSFDQDLKGNGFITNLVVGKNISPHISLSLFTTAKRILTGDLEKQWIIDIYPFFGLRREF